MIYFLGKYYVPVYGRSLIPSVLISNCATKIELDGWIDMIKVLAITQYKPWCLDMSYNHRKKGQMHINASTVHIFSLHYLNFKRYHYYSKFQKFAELTLLRLVILKSDTSFYVIKMIKNSKGILQILYTW